MDEIVYHDRYLGADCTEKVYGDKSLRWTYGTIAGRLALHTVVKRALFSHWYGWWMDRPGTRSRIAPFIKEFAVDENEFACSADEYNNFNEFFYRKLKPAARPVDAGSQTVVFPADGRHLCIPNLADCAGLFVKGQMFDLDKLLGDDTALVNRFRQGSLLLSRLCPTDYHRFHFPVGGVPGDSELLNGPLYSVNPVALCRNIQILATNKRMLTKLETQSCGTVLLLEIGATCVGSIRQTFAPHEEAAKGDEKGYFRFGGSSTIVIFEPGRIQFDDDLVEQSSQHRELYARVGDSLGSLAPTS